MYQFHSKPGTEISAELLSAMSKLYSNHYGRWGPGGNRPGEPVRLRPSQIQKWLTHNSVVVWVEAFGHLIGYAIAVHAHVSKGGTVAWITQLVVHTDHRRMDVGKRLLFSAWTFSDYFAWGLLSANPYAVRALEKATRRRCQPSLIALHADLLYTLGKNEVHYLESTREIAIDDRESKVNTGFHLDHSLLAEMVRNATSEATPWVMGDLTEGWEWFAFTFHDQQQIPLTKKELEEMLMASDEVTKQAYARMRPQLKTHRWAQYAKEEAEFILRNSGVPAGSPVLDFGCGDGRHSIEFAKCGFDVTGVDIVQESVEAARQASHEEGISQVRFHKGDCRKTELQNEFELGICLYDVIGSFVDEHSNFEILKNLANHIKEGGCIFISVMNLELTERLAKNWFSLSSDPDKLLSLTPSSTMEKSGNVFNPDYYLIDRESKIVYRKEQFRTGEDLYEELLVRDRRFTIEEITHMCVLAGLQVKWARFVRAGHWDEALDRESEKAKEILVMCQKPYLAALQQSLF